MPKIREAYRREEIDAETARNLTMASKAQQKDWLALYADPEQYAPRGDQLKQWLFGGQSISSEVALFAVEDYPGLIVCDLFSQDSYFADADLFWQKQNEAIAARRDAYLEAGWPTWPCWNRGSFSKSWDHEKTPKKKRWQGLHISLASQRGRVPRGLAVAQGCPPRPPARRGRRARRNPRIAVATGTHRADAEPCRSALPCRGARGHARPSGCRAAPDGGASHHRFGPVAGSPRAAAYRQ
ncbi:hypothetical protein [Mesorhizobium loti]|uniref:hypothetical protein n=1 Tax=Rhizobium loti TaxID=381 RepID=UPI001FE1CABE|nr:hypothetical protein [Mesorhizobium loti]